MNKFQHYPFLIFFFILLCFSSCEVSRYILLNDENKLIYQHNSCCGVEIEAFDVSVRRIIFTITAKDCSIKFIDSESWLKELEIANNNDFYSFDIANEGKKLFSIKKNESIRFSLVPKDFLSNREVKFIIPKSDNVFCNNQFLFQDSVTFSLKAGKKKNFF